MREFTKEEISLCKQIAKKHRKEIKCGDWILRNGELRLNLDGKLAWLEDGRQDIIIKITNKTEIIPLWTISDCLEFLREKGFNCFHVDSDGDEATLAVDNLRDGISASFLAKTPLEACLKAALATLEEK